MKKAGRPQGSITALKQVGEELLDQTDYKRAICEKLKELGSATPDSLGMALDIPNTLEDRQFLYNALLGLKKRGVLMTPNWGVYVVSPAYDAKGVSRLDEIDQNVEWLLYDMGGIASVHQIFQALGGEYAKMSAEDRKQYADLKTASELRLFNRYQPNPNNSVLLKQVRQSLEKIAVRDFGKQGVWNLPYEKMKGHIITGEYLSVMAMVEFSALFPSAADEYKWLDFRERRFLEIGSLVEDLRLEAALDIDEVITDRRVRNGLLEMKDVLTKSPGVSAARLKSLLVRGRHRYNLRTELTIISQEERAQAEQALEDDPNADVSIYEKDKLWRLMSRFEQGSLRSHLAAPTDLYRGLGELYGVDASSLSLGILVRAPSNTKHKTAIEPRSGDENDTPVRVCAFDPPEDLEKALNERSSFANAYPDSDN